MLSQRAVGRHIIKHLSILDQWSCLQVFPTWRGLEATPVILAQGSEVSRGKITKQFIKSEEQSALIVLDERGLTLFISILRTFPLICSPSFNLVSLDFRACNLTIDDLNNLLSGANFPAFANLERVSVTLQQVSYFREHSQTIWNGNTPVLVEPITPLPRLKSLNILLIPKLSINSTPLAKLMRIALNASEIVLRDRDNSVPLRDNFSWYVRHNFPRKYPNLKQLSISIYSEFLSAMLMESKGDYKSWFPALKKLTIYGQCNYMQLQDLKEYQNIFKGIAVEAPPYTVSLFSRRPIGRPEPAAYDLILRLVVGDVALIRHMPLRKQSSRVHSSFKN